MSSPNPCRSQQHSFLVTGIQRYSVNDGPGIRTTIFLKGCPLKCAWCHNPESINMHQEFFFDEEKCVRCGTCAQTCPEKAIKPPVERKIIKDPEIVPIVSSSGRIFDKIMGNIQSGTFGSEDMYEITEEALHRTIIAEEQPAAEVAPPEFDRAKCTHCMQCVQACTHGALTMVSRPVSFEEAYGEVYADRMFYDASGGGMTLSGGEPLLQPELSLALLRQAREDRIHTALETTGFARWETISRMLPFVNLFLFDLKVMDDVKHKKWTGVSNRLILENIQKIAAAGGKIRIRCVVVHNVNYWDLDHPRAIVEYVKTLGSSVVGIDIIPYHNFAEKKYERLGRKYVFKGFPNIFKEEMEEYRRIMIENGPWRPTIGGFVAADKTPEAE
jgi:pyruvate formate lyase activating enzyme